MICQYIIKGLKVTQDESGGEKANPDLQSTLSYLAAADKVATSSDELAAVALVDDHAIPFINTDGRLQQMPEVEASVFLSC